MKKLLLLFAIITTLSCCKKDDDQVTQNPIDQLPALTQTGANTFGCLINGEPFVVTNTSDQVAIYQQGQLQFGAQGITIILGDQLEENINYSLVGQAEYLVNPNPQLGCHYEFENTYQGYLTFTKIDTENFILSGTFEFSTVNDDCENADITNGRFDLQYIP